MVLVQAAATRAKGSWGNAMTCLVGRRIALADLCSRCRDDGYGER